VSNLNPTGVVEKFVDVPDGFLYCRTLGQGPDVVLLNAGAADLRMWDTTVGWLGEIARVTTFDYRDTGLSSAGLRPYSEIEDIAAVMDAAGVRRALLVGVSDGARRALAFAHRYPDRVARVVAVGGAFGEFPDPTPEESAARREMHEHFARLERIRAEEGMHARAAADIGAWGAALGEDQRRRMIGLQMANSYWVELEDYLGAELDPPVKDRFGEIAVRIQVVVGGHDFAGTRLWARRLAEQARSARLTVIPEADHFPMLSAPQEFERVVREFVVLPEVIPIVHEPDFRTSTIGRYAEGQFFGSIHGTHIDALGEITVMLHLFDDDGRHTGSTIRGRVALDDADALLAQMLATLPGAEFGDIAIRPFLVMQDGVRFGLVDDTAPESGGPHAELYPQGLGFAAPFDGYYDT